MAQEDSFGPILVTGGAGYLGSHIVEALLKDNSFSSVEATVQPEVTTNRCISGAVYHDCDVGNATQLTELLDKVKPQVILHTIGPGYFSPPEVHYRVTYELSKQLIAIALQHPNVQALVYTSSAEAIHLKPEYNSFPVREDQVPLHTLTSGPTAYSRTKAAIDTLVIHTNTPSTASSTASTTFPNQLLTATLRVTGIYGPRDRLTIAEMLKLVNTPKTYFQIGPNRLTHDWIHVDNCARAHVLAATALLLAKQRKQRADGLAFNISDGAPMRFWDFAHRVYEHGGDANWARDGRRRVVRVPIGLVLFLVGVLEWAVWMLSVGRWKATSSRATFEWVKTGCWLDISRAKGVLGYEPMFGTEEGLGRTVRWFRENEGWEGEK